MLVPPPQDLVQEERAPQALQVQFTGHPCVLQGWELLLLPVQLIPP